MIISAAKASQAAEILGVELDTLDAEDLTTAWRKVAKKLHPDHAEAFDQPAWANASWANEVLKRWLESRSKPVEIEGIAPGDCRACAGSGRIAVGKPTGFGKRPTTVQCVMCNGSGSLSEGGQRAHFGRSE